VRNADRLTAVLLLVFSAAFSAGALKYYRWWGDDGPGSAFLPFWLGLVMALLALMLLVKSLREKRPGAAWLPRGEGGSMRRRRGPVLPGIRKPMPRASAFR